MILLTTHIRWISVLLMLTGASSAWALHGSNAPSFFPVFFNSFNYAGTVSMLVQNTHCPTQTNLLPGTIPGMAEGFKVDLSVRREALKTFFHGEFYHDQWGGLYVPLALFEIQHQILRLHFGDILNTIHPLFLANQTIRGGGMHTSFEIFDDFLKLDVQFQVGRCREGTDYGSPLRGYYNVQDSLGAYPRNLGLFRINMTEGQYNRYHVAFNFLHTEDYTKGVKVDSTLFPPRRSRLYGVDANYLFPGGIADVQGHVYISSFRENINNSNETDDIYDKAVLIATDGNIDAYRYRAGYRYIGKHYYSGGNPYLQTDRNGFHLGGTYTRSDLFQVAAGTEYYRTNLDKHQRTPTGQVLSGHIRTSLEKKRWPRLYLQMRFKGAWTDSVLVEVVDEGQEVFAEQFRKEKSTTFSTSLGGDMTLGKVWLSGWTNYLLYHDQSHEIFPVLLRPAPTGHWLLGLRTRWRARPSFRLDNGLSVALVRQEQADIALGLNETIFKLYGRGEYRPPAPLKKTVIRTGLEYVRQISDWAERDYGYIAFNIAPHYSYHHFLTCELKYNLMYVQGRISNYNAHTFSLETVVAY